MVMCDCVFIYCRQQRSGMTSQWRVTPRFGGAQTPMVGSMTPMHGMSSGRTPVYGSQTPQHRMVSEYLLIRICVGKRKLCR